MKQMLLIVISILFNVLAQILIKYAGKSGAGTAGVASWLSVWILLAIAAYGLSFLLTVRIFAENKLSTVVPLMAGATFMLVSMAGVLLFDEDMTARKAMGSVAILAGVFLLAS
jgi:multidrug transporter EmrE-like cation transporter